jgi:hypothetical protein
LLDSGSRVTVLGKNSDTLIKRWNLNIKPYKNLVTNASGDRVGILGIVYLPFELNGQTHILKTLVAPSLSRELILGLDAFKELNIKVDYIESLDFEQSDENSWKLDSSQDRELRNVLNLFLKSSDDFIGTTEIVSHEIDTGDAKPFNVRSHMWSPYKEAEIDRELNRMLNLGVVEPSNSPYSNPIVPVSKKDGSIRLCLDARKLNKQTKPSSYPLPLINRILGRFKSTKYLSTVDLKDAYWQVPLK